MGHRDANGIHLSEENWAKISVDTMGFSPEHLIHALEAQMAGKQARTQTGASAASGDLATRRCYWFQNWYHGLGFNISLPFPPVSDEEFKRRQNLGQTLFYRPPTSDVPYEALMKAVGQGEHWTVAENDDRKKIVWEPAQEGYWFWTEIAQTCPRLGTSWNVLTKELKLNPLSLEEYVIVWWAIRAETNTLLDINTWSWFRTRFGQGALAAAGYDGGVGVSRDWTAGHLALSYDGGGGRLAEVVQT